MHQLECADVCIARDGYPCECGLERYVSLRIIFVLFGDAFCDAVHQPHQSAEGKPSIR